MNFSIHPIGVLRTPFKERFGVPRQSGLVPAATGILELSAPYDRPEAVAGLEGFSHLWLIFLFHGIPQRDWRPTVRPPRLGGQRRVGVFASRSPFRPNPIGLSAVRLGGIECGSRSTCLHLEGVDLLDGTPILDIKPYLPYADSVPSATGGYAGSPPAPLEVTFTRQAEEVLATLPADEGKPLRTLISQILAQDPRPAYENRNDRERLYGIRLLDFDCRWRIHGARVEVVEIVR